MFRALHFDAKKGENAIITYHEDSFLKPSEMKDLIVKSLDSDKAENILCVPLSDGSGLADYMIIATGTSSRHVGALARKLKERLHLKNVQEVRVEGLGQCDWVVLDAGDAIVHLFRPEVRDFYNIEKMWCEHPTLDIVSDQVLA